MTSYNYIELKSSNNSINKKFYVVIGGYEPNLRKLGSIEDTLNGGIDYSVGALREAHSLIIRVKHTSDEAGFGSLSDLRSLFELNNPAGTPSNVITYIDHFGGSHNVYIVGEFGQSLLTTLIEGSQAVYLVKLVLYFIPT